MQLSKKHYFMLQTGDQLCKAYGIIIGAPVEHDNLIYNYNPSNDFINNINYDITEVGSTYKIFGLENSQMFTKSNKILSENIIKGREINIKNIEKTDRMIIETLENKESEVEISRYWFNKYIKYKNKYLKLKKKINRNFNLLEK